MPYFAANDSCWAISPQEALRSTLPAVLQLKLEEFDEASKASLEKACDWRNRNAECTPTRNARAA